jgi:hypothetical protein
MAETAFAVGSHGHGEPACRRLLIETESGYAVALMVGAYFYEDDLDGSATTIRDSIRSTVVAAAKHCKRQRTSAVGDFFKFRCWHEGHGGLSHT